MREAATGRISGQGCSTLLRDVLTLKVKGKQETEFLMRFQQFTPPVMAKGVEDTAFYCYNRLMAMCEVGGDPGSNGLSVKEFHAYNAKMQATHPHTMVTLSTHDTKRSDDVRARLAVLSEIPAEFGEALNRWSRMNNELRAELKLGEYPDRNTEYMLYQTMIGAWPITVERLREYMLKAVREAKQRTTWTSNNTEFEDALRKFIGGVMKHGEFVTDLEQFVETVKDAGRVNSLTQTLMKHTAPGVPDLYQGAELWDLSLVDPDNRRPVDYRLRAKLAARDKADARGEGCGRGDAARGGWAAEDVDDPPGAVFAAGAAGEFWCESGVCAFESEGLEGGACDCLSARRGCGDGGAAVGEGAGRCMGADFGGAAGGTVDEPFDGSVGGGRQGWGEMKLLRRIFRWRCWCERSVGSDERCMSLRCGRQRRRRFR